jgi:hypothetical protein
MIPNLVLKVLNYANVVLKVLNYANGLINKDKNRGRFLFAFPHPSQNRTSVWVNSPCLKLGNPHERDW